MKDATDNWVEVNLLYHAPEVLGEKGSALDIGQSGGTPLGERNFNQIDFGPELITLYQRAIEAEAETCGLSLHQVIRETLWHEIAHYFGFSEEEMDRTEDFWAGEGRILSY